MKERFQNLIELLSFRNMWDDQEEEDWEDYDRKEEYVSGDEYIGGSGGGVIHHFETVTEPESTVGIDAVPNTSVMYSCPLYSIFAFCAVLYSLPLF